MSIASEIQRVLTEIQRIKTNIANAYQTILAKGGTLPQIQNSQNLANAVSSISGGAPAGEHLEDYFSAGITGGDLRENGSTVTSINLPLPWVTAFANQAMSRGYLPNIVSCTLDLPNCTNLRQFAYYADKLETLTVTSLGVVTDIYGGLSGAARLTNVTLPYNCIAMPSTTGAFNLTDCRLLTDASVISICNSLREGVTGSIQFYATQKNKLPLIMGTVSSDITETYHIFTADNNGTVSLQEFVANYKGWTIV